MSGERGSRYRFGPRERGGALAGWRAGQIVTVAVGLVLAAGAATGGDATDDDAKSAFAKLKGIWVRELDGKTYIVNFNGEKFATIFEFAEGTTTTSGVATSSKVASQVTPSIPFSVRTSPRRCPTNTTSNDGIRCSTS